MTDITVLTYNIHKGFTLGNLRFVLDEMRAQIRAIDPDLIFLQEVASFRDQEAQLEYLADQVWPHTAYGKNAFYPKGHHGNAILSRYPMESVLNIDLTTNRLEKRGLLHAKLQMPSRTMHLLNTHLSLTSVARRKQLMKICNYVETSIPQDEPMIFAGDLNDWKNRLSLPLSQRLNLHEVFHQLSGSVQKTFPSIAPILKLDRIYFRKMSPERAQVLSEENWRRLSDHLPLLATFQF